MKGEFRDILWMVFESQSQRDLKVESLNNTKAAILCRVVWIALDLLLLMHVEKKCLFELKRIVLSWGGKDSKPVLTFTRENRSSILNLLSLLVPTTKISM